MPEIPKKNVSTLDRKAFDVARNSAERNEENKLYHTSAWRRARKAFIQENPLCLECLKVNRTVAADVVDHIEPHRGDLKLFWDRRNWQPLCHFHHNKKSGAEAAKTRKG